MHAHPTYLVLPLLEEAVLVLGHLPDVHGLPSTGCVEVVSLGPAPLWATTDLKPELFVLVSDIL